jgi:hypothetical protein
MGGWDGVPHMPGKGLRGQGQALGWVMPRAGFLHMLWAPGPGPSAVTGQMQLLHLLHLGLGEGQGQKLSNMEHWQHLTAVTPDLFGSLVLSF